MGCTVHSEMHAFGKDYYKLTRILLSSVGLWPYQSRKIVIMCRLFVCIAFAPAPFLLAFKLQSPDINTIVYAEVIMIFMVSIIVFFKFLNHCINIQKIKVLIEYMQDDWKTLKDKDEIKILNRFTTIGRRYNLFCILFCYINTGIFMLLPLISPTLDYFDPRNETRPRQHPFEAEYFVDQEEYFFPILFHMYIVLLTTITIVVATDAIYITCIFHACGMFSIVGFRLENACSTTNQMTHVYIKHCVAQKNVTNAVQYHWKTNVERLKVHESDINSIFRRFINTINAAYGWVFFIMMILIVISISITLFNILFYMGVKFLQAAILVGEWKEMLLSLIFATGQLTQVFFNVYPAQRLFDVSSKLFIQTYNSEWYMAPIPVQRSMLIIMQRCITSSPIIAGKMVVISMEMYALIVQTSMSYFTTLYSFK